MKEERFTEEQIIAVLKEQEAGAQRLMFAQSKFRKRPFTFWKPRYGGMKVCEAKRLKALKRRTPS
ncbi:transposase [Rhizobium laguerreae]|uniref:transposase n=1 Tax=Rhizobium laguerreae TaxID=1076926 RepID=UPI001C916FB2|nr:hypothetical protein [Rhizobium laguerreae]